MGKGIVHIDGIDRTDLIAMQGAVIETTANQINSLFRFVLRDESRIDGTQPVVLRERMEVIVTDDELDPGQDRIFGGQIASIEPRIDGKAVVYRVACQNFNSLLDQRVIDDGERTDERFDDDDVQFIIAHGGDLGLTASDFVSRTRSEPLGDINYSNKSLRRALAELRQHAPATVWIDDYKRTHWTDPDSAQKVRNGDFEGQFAIWQLHAEAEVDEDGGPGGTGDAALVTQGTGSGRNETTQLIDGITGLRRYVVMADMRGSAARVRFEWLDSSDQVLATDELAHDDADWGHQRDILTAPAPAVKVRVRLGGEADFTTEVRHDNVRMVGETAAFPAVVAPDAEHEIRDWQRPSEAPGPINRVKVIGDGIEGWREQAASIAYFGERFEAVIEDDRVKQESGIDSRAQWVFRRWAFPSYSGRYATYHAGLRVGDYQIVEIPMLGLTSIEWIATIRTTFDGNGLSNYEVTYGVAENDIGTVLATLQTAFADSQPSPKGVPGVDLNPPAVPQNLQLQTGIHQSPDGVLKPFLLATWNAVADVDLDAYELQRVRSLVGQPQYELDVSGSGGTLDPGDYVVAVTGVGVDGGETTAEWQGALIENGERLFVEISPMAHVTAYRVYVRHVEPEEGESELDPPLFAFQTSVTGAPVEITAEGAGDPPPEVSTAITWVNPTTVRTGAVSHYTDHVIGGVFYAARVRAVDRSGNRSGWSNEAGVVVGRDEDAPPIPEVINVIPFFRGVALRWERIDVPDLWYYQVRWSVDQEDWSRLTTATNWIIIADLEPETGYWLQVRSVDRSGNTRTSDEDDTAVIADDEPEAGWSEPVLAFPQLVGSTDIAAGSIIADHISAEGLDAGRITAGELRIGGMPGMPDLLSIFDSTGQEIGRWDEMGLFITDPNDPNKRLRIVDGVMSFSLDGGETWTTAISGEGIRADAITLGTATGGHNMVPNSAFELAEFASELMRRWEDDADWNNTIGMTVNIAVSGGSLRLNNFSF